MSAIPANARGCERSSYAALHGHRGIVAILLALAAVAWWSTARRMAGMDAGPGTDLGGLGWFTVTWAVMMAAMMLPSLTPAAAVYSTGSGPGRAGRPLVFAGGYLLVWSAAGAAAYTAFAAGKALLPTALAWDNGGQAAAAGALALTALYELTPLKRTCLRRCRHRSTPRATQWRDRHAGALIKGVRFGGWCLGCCAGLMAALFALGVMSLTWMALIAGLVTLEKLAPWPRATTTATTVVLLALAIGVAAAPDRVPRLVVPGSSPANHVMKRMTLAPRASELHRLQGGTRDA